MVFFPDQALRFPDPEGGSRSLARGFAAGQSFSRTELARLGQAAESERAADKAALDRDQLSAFRERTGVQEGKLALDRQTADRKTQSEGVATLSKILTGVANAPDDIFPQVLRSGIETAKRLGVDTSKYEGLTPDQARQQARVDLQALQGFQDQKATPATNPVNIKFPDGRIQGFDPRSQELQEALSVPGAVEVGLNVQASSVEELPGKNRQDEIRANLNATTRARSKISKMRKSINDKRSRAGITGTISRLAQRGVGIATDLADIGVDAPDVISDISRDVANDIQNGRAEESVATFFDPKLSQNEVFENSLAYALARARKGGGRLNLQDVANARPDVEVTGLKSVDEVLAKLEAVDQEIAESQEDLKSRLKGESRDTVPRFRVEGGRLIEAN